MLANLQAAKTSHASKDGGEYAGRPVASRPAASGSSSRPPRPKPAGDKWANYSSAASLGFDDEETKLSSFEIEQMVRGRGTNVGEWEEVKEAAPAMTYTEDGVPALDLKRKAEEEEDHNNFKFQHRDKRPAHDVYDDDDWDPKAALGSIKLKTKEKKLGEAAPESKPAVKKEEATDKAGFSKVGWSGKLNMTEGDPVKEEPKDEGKDEGDSKPALDDVAEPTAESKVVEPATEIKTEAAAPETVAAAPEPAPSSGASMFKKRRPPPSSRKK